MNSGSTEPAATPPAPADWAALANQAGSDVNQRFGHRLMNLPGTWIGSVTDPAPRFQSPKSEWHYWWQAHYLDAILDTGFRALREGNQHGAVRELKRAQNLLRGINLRNFGVLPNYFFDDMAWLALAAGRLNELSLAAVGKPSRYAGFASSTLTRQLHFAYDSVLGGGLYWSRKRDFKNTPVNAPAALHFARIGQLEKTQILADWLRTELFDPVAGLYLDGIHPSTTGRDVERNLYTYNQGPILAALLQLDHPKYVSQAGDLIAAVALHFTLPGKGIRLEEGDDGSLFTGILCRYLAQAARDRRLPAQARATASRLVLETAAALTGQAPAKLSAAVQRWTIFEAAATCQQP